MLSVLMPVYNVEKYLKKTLQSVADQSYKDFEVIMIDDGSTDSSGKICDEWAEKDRRFKVIHTQNGGVSRARNTALANAKGEYIFFMDSDDLILPETFEELIASLEENEADIAVGSLYYTDDKGNPIDKLNSLATVKNEVLTKIQYLEKLTQNGANYYCTSTNKIFKSELFEGITYPEDKINEDEARIYRIIFNADKIVTREKRYYNYIKHPTGITGTVFGYKNFDREDAFIGRINFYLEKGLKDLAERTAIFALDSAIVTFAKSVETGVYYGKGKKKLHEVFAFYMKNIPPFGSLSAFEKKVAVIGALILSCSDVYAEYVNFKIKTEALGAPEAVKDEIFELIMKAMSLLPTRDRIVFESHPDLSDNAYPVYKYLLEKGLDKKYEFVWLTENKERYRHINPSVSFVEFSQTAKSIKDKLKYMYTVSTARALIYSNKLLGTHGKDRISLCLQHGMPLKSSNGTYAIKNKCTAAVCVSEFFKENYEKDFRVEPEKMIFTGFPRNDLLLKDNNSVPRLGFDVFDKIIFWLPTYRQRSVQSLNKDASGFEMDKSGTGIPVLETKSDFENINNFLKENNCLIILKPHPAQDLSAIDVSSLSNFKIINDLYLHDNGVQLYELLGKTDGMITDYSSVYYDYLLTDKPIGLTVDDIDEYIAKRGFVYKNPLDILKGEYISNTDSLLKFIKDIKEGRDGKLGERTEIKNRIHTITDGSSAKRVGDYIINQLG